MGFPTDADSVRFFVNGQAMAGGPLHRPISETGVFLGPARTAPRYRFWAHGTEFPALQHAPENGWKVPGELYLVRYAVLRDAILPSEPAELELSVLELDDGSGAMAMVLRSGVPTDGLRFVEIAHDTGWRQYLGQAG